MQERRSLRQSVLEGANFHPKEGRPTSFGCELSPVDNNETNQYSDTNKSSSPNNVDSSGSSKETEWQSEAQTLTVHHKTKKLAQTRKRRWHSLREKSHKAGNKQAHIKTKMSLKKRKNVPVSETKKQWVEFGYI